MHGPSPSQIFGAQSPYRSPPLLFCNSGCSCEERVIYDIEHSRLKDTENLGKERESPKTWSMTKKSHQKFWPWKWKFFPKKGHLEILVREKIFRPPKLGARAPPLPAVDIIGLIIIAKEPMLHSKILNPAYDERMERSKKRQRQQKHAAATEAAAEAEDGLGHGRLYSSLGA